MFQVTEANMSLDTSEPPFICHQTATHPQITHQETYKHTSIHTSCSKQPHLGPRPGRSHLCPRQTRQPPAVVSLSDSRKFTRCILLPGTSFWKKKKPKQKKTRSPVHVCLHAIWALTLCTVIAHLHTLQMVNAVRKGAVSLYSVFWFWLQLLARSWV